jgi:hypothetical protein
MHHVTHAKQQTPFKITQCLKHTQMHSNKAASNALPFQISIIIIIITHICESHRRSFLAPHHAWKNYILMFPS